jgi:hypothetical protein
MSDENFDKEVELASGQVSEGKSDQANDAGDVSPEMKEQTRQLESLVKMDPDFANTDEYKDLMSSIEKSKEEVLGNKKDNKEEEKEEEQEDDAVDSDDQSDDQNDVFGISKSKKKKKDFSVDFDIPDEMASLISSKFGVDDPSKFFSSVDKWRTQAQEGADASKEYEALSSDLQSMPVEIKQAIQMWANGDDYANAFNTNQRLDFSGSFKDQDPENLVQHYLEDEYNGLVDKYNEDKLSDSDFEDRVNLLARTTKRMFNQDAQALETEREEFVEKQRAESKALKESAILSVENLGKAYPDFSRSEITKIKRVLVDGSVDNIFVNSDGSYKEDAAELLAYAMYGKKLMESARNKAERQGESKANLKTVDSSPKNVRRQKSSDQKRGMNMDAVSHLAPAFKKDPYA